MPSNKKLLQAAAGNAGESLYVEDVFSTYLFTAKSGTTDNGDMVNGINLADEGGMVWIKDRTEAYPHNLIDTERGNTKRLQSQSTAAQSDTGTYGLLAFNQDGFELGTGGGAMWGRDTGNNEVTTWTFRKAEKFFDVVTYTGTGSAQNIAHNLGVAPAVVIVKNISASYSWHVYHISIGNTKRLLLNSTAAESVASATYWNNTSPTDTVFTVGTNGAVNTNGQTYVAYLFASDAGGFGDDGSESIIKCGSFIEPSSGAVSVDLGFEPQFVLAKPSSTAGSWYLFDVMRGMPVSPATARLQAESSAAEVLATAAGGPWPLPTATGFDWKSGFVGAGETWVYIAIRRPMKTPESGTEVFTPIAYTGNNAARTITAGFPIDAELNSVRSSGAGHPFVARLTGGRDMTTDTSDEEGTLYTSYLGFDNNTGLEFKDATGYGYYNSSANTYIAYMFKRATGFFDIVAYTGTGSATTQAHNLKVVPELMVVKRRSSFESWQVYSKDMAADEYMQMNGTAGATNVSGTLRWNNTRPTDSVFSIGTHNSVNGSGSTYVAYLFATVAGVSKVGSYTGTAATLNVDCGFSAGARFILIKREDSTGDWYVWDSERGIVSGNDPYLRLNSATAEVTNTDYIDPLSSGFTITSSAPAALNASGGTYIFLAIA
jgi:hypothetical protein